jgi:histidinol dehydrogenase
VAIRLDARDAGFEAAFAALLSSKRESAPDVDTAVAGIISDVRARGDVALVEYTERFDRLALTADKFRLSTEEIQEHATQASAESVAALKVAAIRIRSFHEKQKPEDLRYVDDAGVELGARWSPVAAAGLYVPGGLAAYPSSLLMNAIPALVAGVPRLAVTVPTPDGVSNPLVMAAVQILGITEVYRLGGSQAIAALAYGTETVPPVDVIVGPGNAYVAAAKRQVFGAVGIDMIAGPSEILIVADGANDPAWIAADLLSQAEHDAAAQSILMTDDSDFADQVFVAVERQLDQMSRGKIARESWSQHGAVLLLSSLDDAPALVDRLAPEHLELAVANPDGLFDQIHHAGAVFLGRHTPEAVGDYVAGPNHVLPTARSARFASALSVLDFMKRTSVVRCDSAGLARVGPMAATLADAEGLSAHAHSVRVRLR